MEPRANSVAVIVLAAGLSRRFGTQNKLLIDWEGEPLIRRVVGTAVQVIWRCASDPQVIVVTGHEADEVEAALMGMPVVFARNERYHEGMGTSIAAGVKAAPQDATGFLIVPGDMPRLSVETLTALLGHAPTEDFPSPGVAIATCRASWGRTAPTSFAGSFRRELEGLDGDTGARFLLKSNEQRVWDLAVSDAEVSDID